MYPRDGSKISIIVRLKSARSGTGYRCTPWASSLVWPSWASPSAQPVSATAPRVSRDHAGYIASYMVESSARVMHPKQLCFIKLTARGEGAGGTYALLCRIRQLVRCFHFDQRTVRCAFLQSCKKMLAVFYLRRLLGGVRILADFSISISQNCLSVSTTQSVAQTGQPLVPIHLVMAATLLPVRSFNAS
jgi:hypothetical protein